MANCENCNCLFVFLKLLIQGVVKPKSEVLDVEDVHSSEVKKKLNYGFYLLYNLNLKKVL